jgi:CheY-like chemotaxis protein
MEVEECNVNTETSVTKNGQEALDFVFQRGIYKDAKAGFNFTRHYHPIYNGHEVLQQIKADPVLKKIPVTNYIF